MPHLLDTDPTDGDRDDASPRVWIHGRREIVPEELSAIARAYEGPVTTFGPQFSNQSFAGDRASSGALYAAAHEWLSEHATGPWLWSEEEQGHGSRHVVSVYIERISDQKAFQEAHWQLFRYRPDPAGDLERLAAVRGALPGLTARESFGVWTNEHAGYRLLHADDLGDGGVRVVLSHPEIERRFLERFGHVFREQEWNGERAFVATGQKAYGPDSPGAWFRENGAVGSLSGGPTEDGYRYVVEIREPDVAEALERDWGHVFQADGTGRRFSTPDYPSAPARPLPDDFRAYLQGDAESYEAPYLPEALRAWRSVPPAQAPGPGRP